MSFHKLFVCVGLFFLLGGELAGAQGLGTLRGIVKDPSGALIPAATVTLKSAVSEREQNTRTDAKGEFMINAIPFGEYILQVEHPGFATLSRSIQIIIGAAPNVELTLQVGSATTTVKVTTTALEVTAPSAAQAPVMVSGNEITEQLPGADRMSSLAFVTETTPGAFVLHDHLHVRGGHQILKTLRKSRSTAVVTARSPVTGHLHRSTCSRVQALNSTTTPLLPWS